MLKNIVKYKIMSNKNVLDEKAKQIASLDNDINNLTNKILINTQANHLLTFEINLLA